MANTLEQQVRAEYETVHTYQILREELLNLQILEFFKQSKEKTAELLNEFEVLYEQKEKSIQLVSYLRSGVFKRKFTEKKVGDYVFTRQTLPVTIKDYFEKVTDDEFARIIKELANIDISVLDEALADAFIETFETGGKVGFNFFGIGTDFKITNEKVVEAYKEYASELSGSLGTQASSQIQAAIIEGINNGESIQTIKSRVLDIWDAPIIVEVPTTYGKDGEVLRAGYRYNMSASNWAETVARTETSKAFSMGKVESWRQTGVVSAVEFVTALDERVCPICAPLDGAVYSLEDALSIIPVHARCRCTWIPLLDCEGLSGVECFDSTKLKAEENISVLYKKVA